MKQIRTIVADDEPAARARIAKLVARDAALELVAECRNGSETIDAVARFKPDLIFLDVQMPQASGFEVVEKLGNGKAPFIVFVTAHDQYALKAFNVNAVDYLLKPYDDDRFYSSVEKAKKWMDLRMSSKLTGKLMDLMRQHMQANSEFTEHFIIRDRGHERKVSVSEILFFRAEGNYLHLQLKDRHFLFRQTMNAVETELDPDRFLRVHRSFILNTAHIRSHRYTGNIEFIFSMANGEHIMSGRSYKERIDKVLQEQEG